MGLKKDFKEAITILLTLNNNAITKEASAKNLPGVISTILGPVSWSFVEQVFQEIEKSLIKLFKGKITYSQMCLFDYSESKYGEPLQSIFRLVKFIHNWLKNSRNQLSKQEVSIFISKLDIELNVILNKQTSLTALVTEIRKITNNWKNQLQ